MNRKDTITSSILEAATSEFLVKGLDSASMQNISMKANISKRTLYKYFSSKEDIYNELINQVLNQIQSMCNPQYDSNLSIEKQISTIASNKLKLLLNDSFLNISKIIFGEMLKGRAPTPKDLQRMNSSETYFHNWIVDAKNDGEITSPLDNITLANQFHSIIKGQAYWPILLGMKKKQDLNLKSITQQSTDFFINSFCKK